jgi:hypothetical protein
MGKFWFRKKKSYKKSAACSTRVGDRTGCWIMLAKEMGVCLR